MPKLILPGGGMPQLKRLKYIAPQYPASTMLGPRTADLTLEFVVGADGAVVGVHAIKSGSTGNEDPLYEATIAAIRQWRYEPFSVSGVPAMVCGTLHLHLSRSEQWRVRNTP